MNRLKLSSALCSPLDSHLFGPLKFQPSQATARNPTSSSSVAKKSLQ
jgi:hypothetical protein